MQKEMVVMFGLETLGGISRAAAVVGIVFAEAIALHVGYGALTQVVGPPVRNALRDD